MILKFISVYVCICIFIDRKLEILIFVNCVMYFIFFQGEIDGDDVELSFDDLEMLLLEEEEGEIIKIIG